MAGTGNPIGSTAFADFEYNVGVAVDNWANSTDNTVLLRTINGVQREVPTLNYIATEGANTVSQLQNDGANAIQALRIETPFTFTEGGTLTAPNQAVLYTTNGRYYRWDGSFPKTVTAGTDPTADSTWVDVGQAALRSDLGDGSKSGSVVARMPITADSLVDLLNTPFIDGRTYSNNGFYPDSTVGGGTWKAVSGADLTQNNGGTVVTLEALQAWKDAAIAAGGVTRQNLIDNLNVLLDWTGTGTGAFVRIDVEEVDLFMCGGVADYDYVTKSGTDNSTACSALSKIIQSNKIKGVIRNGDFLVSGDQTQMPLTESNIDLEIEKTATIIKDGGQFFCRVLGSDTSKQDNVRINCEGLITVPTVGQSVANGGVAIGAGSGREYGSIKIPELNTLGMGQYGLSTGSQSMFLDSLIIGKLNLLGNGTEAVNILSDPLVLKPGQGEDDTQGHIKFLSIESANLEQKYNTVSPLGTAAGKIQYTQKAMVGEVFCKGGTETTFAIDHVNGVFDSIQSVATDADGVQLSGQSTTDLTINDLKSTAKSINDSALTFGSTGSNGITISNADLFGNVVSTNNSQNNNLTIKEMSCNRFKIDAAGSKITDSEIRNVTYNEQFKVNADNSDFFGIKGKTDININNFTVNGNGNEIQANTKGTESGAFPINVSGDNNIVYDSFQNTNGAARAYNITGVGNELRNCLSDLASNLRDTGTSTKYTRSQGDFVLNDVGDGDYSFNVGVSPKTIIFDSPITKDRTVSISNLSATEGNTLKVIRTENSTGAFVVNAGVYKTLAPGEYAEFIHSGSSWVLTGFGQL